MISDKEIMEKGIKLLEDNLGDIETDRFIANIMQKGRETPKDYTEWRRENLFKGMTAKEIHAAAIEYAKTHNL